MFRKFLKLDEKGRKIFEMDCQDLAFKILNEVTKIHTLLTQDFIKIYRMRIKNYKFNRNVISIFEELSKLMKNFEKCVEST